MNCQSLDLAWVFPGANELNFTGYFTIYSNDSLTHCGLVTPYGDMEIWVNIGSGNGLLPDGTKPLPEPMLTYQWGPVTFIPGQNHKYLSCQSLDLAWAFPGASELNFISYFTI